MSYAERVGATAIADSPDEVRRRTREQLLKGASQIKVHAGGGISSDYDPIDTTQYSLEEMKAAVGAAEDWGTYVCVHAYTPRAIRRAIEAGVKVIEHGQLMDEATAKLMADKGIWWSFQPFLLDEDANTGGGRDAAVKRAEVSDGTKRAIGYAQKYKIKMAWGTDILFNPQGPATQNRQLTKMVQFMTPAQVLKMATHDNAQLLALSGPRNPYPGKLGVVEVGALADLLLVDGDPIADLTVLNDPAKNMLVIMKDGRIYKNLTAK
jgi:imidazolonepropionase-like amidohydrolase